MIQILRSRPHLWFQLYWVIYLVWFFALDWTITDPTYIIHSPIDDLIPFNEWFIFPYCSWFFLLAGVTGLLWWFDTRSYDKLCLMMFSGMTFCLILYMILPNGVDLRPTAEQVGRDNFAMDIMQLFEAINKVNITVVGVTHEHELVHKLAAKYNNRVITLADGMVASDTAHPEVARRYAAKVAARERDAYDAYDED